jgi:hypothetical protein
VNAGELHDSFAGMQSLNGKLGLKPILRQESRSGSNFDISNFDTPKETMNSQISAIETKTNSNASIQIVLPSRGDQIFFEVLFVAFSLVLAPLPKHQGGARFVDSEDCPEYVFVL